MKSTTLVMPAADLARNPNDDFISGFKECPGSKILTLLGMDSLIFGGLGIIMYKAYRPTFGKQCMKCKL